MSYVEESKRKLTASLRVTITYFGTFFSLWVPIWMKLGSSMNTMLRMVWWRWLIRYFVLGSAIEWDVNWGVVRFLLRHLRKVNQSILKTALLPQNRPQWKSQLACAWVLYMIWMFCNWPWCHCSIIALHCLTLFIIDLYHVLQSTLMSLPVGLLWAIFIFLLIIVYHCLIIIDDHYLS